MGNGLVWNAATGENVHDHCLKIFKRPSELIAHYEKSQCLHITRRDFQGERQQKHIVKQIMTNPHYFTTQINESKKAKRHAADMEWPEDEDTTDGFGGVAFGQDILADEDPEQTKGLPSLHPRANTPNLMDWDVPMWNKSTVAWPMLPREENVEEMRSKMEDLTLSRPSTPGCDRSVSAGAERNEGSEHGMSAPTTPQTTSKASAAGLHPPQQYQMTLALRTKSETSGSEPAEPEAGVNWDAIRRADAYTKKQDTKTNLFHARWWDSTSADYAPDLFWHPLLEKYRCPFPGCEMEYSQQESMDIHLRHVHVMTGAQCPTCQKKYDSVTALVQHFEASAKGGKCWVARSKDYVRILDEVTGGFLAVSLSSGEKLLGYATRGKGENRRVIRTEVGEPQNRGITKAKYVGKTNDGAVGW